MTHEIKYKADPIGTMHDVSLTISGMPFTFRYKVYAAHNVRQFSPTSDEPTIFLVLAERTGKNPPQYISLPLSKFVEISQPVAKADVFYKPTNEEQA